MKTRKTLAPASSVSVEVVTAVARRAGVDEVELPRLSEVIDTDALDRLYSASPEGLARGPVRVGFEYCDYRVVVEGDGTVSLTRLRRVSDAAVDTA